MRAGQGPPGLGAAKEGLRDMRQRRAEDRRSAAAAREFLRYSRNHDTPLPRIGAALSESTRRSRRVGDAGEHATRGFRTLEGRGGERTSHAHLCGGGDPATDPVTCIPCGRIALPMLIEAVADCGWRVPFDVYDDQVLEVAHILSVVITHDEDLARAPGAGGGSACGAAGPRRRGWSPRGATLTT